MGIPTPFLIFVLICVAIEFVIVASTVSIDGPSPTEGILLALSEGVLLLALPARTREPLKVLVGFVLLLSCERASMSP